MILKKDESNKYIIDKLNYDSLTLIYSSLEMKRDMIIHRITLTNISLNETTDSKMYLQLRSELDYLKKLKKDIDAFLNKVHLALVDV